MCGAEARGRGRFRLDIDRVVSFGALIDAVYRGALPRLSYSVATAFIERLLDAVDIVHRSGAHFRFLGPGNVLITADGSIRFVGVGGLQCSNASFSTPEVALGGRGSVAADLGAAYQLLRWSMPAVELPVAVRRMYEGRPSPAETPFWKKMVRVEQRLASANPLRRRVNVRSARAIYRAFWRFVGVRPDEAALTRYAARSYARLTDPSLAATYDSVSGIFELSDGRRIDLHHSRVQARLLAALIHAHEGAQLGLSPY